ncbi:hypothetical protein HL653_18720 [Sphingomonas sp. AP4-R1]|uniref:hypothetical protein n=1 Tax=Sphingomonas sp. AP4-R1 TaxID=2735134 RepID=UPI00149353EC|nr:hypothetical protein [Sphingomonas sp. AP4-R1]QJU59515.1 hypothetical protein HL653_18720 [Sphingomonas sp. AP4-R1]
MNRQAFSGLSGDGLENDVTRIVIGLLGLAVSAGLCAGLALPASAQVASEAAAQAAPGGAPGTVALSADERAAVLDAAARRPDSELPINGAGRQIHGTVGMEMDSRGGHALYGTTAVPLGNNGVAAFSFMTGRSGRWR